MEQFIKVAENIQNVTALDRDILNQLIDRIVVGDRVRNGQAAEQKIRIDYKFIGKAV